MQWTPDYKHCHVPFTSVFKLLGPKHNGLNVSITHIPHNGYHLTAHTARVCYVHAD